MMMHRSLLVFWSLLATIIGGAFTVLFFMGNSAVNSLYLHLADVQTCIETYGTLTCDIRHIIGGPEFAMFAVGALIAVFCALPTILRFAVGFPDVRKVRLGFSVGAGLCVGAVFYIVVKQLGLVGGFLFGDLTALCFFGMFAGLYAWMACMASAGSSLKLIEALE